jgi:hypothetical protein
MSDVDHFRRESVVILLVLSLECFRNYIIFSFDKEREPGRESVQFCGQQPYIFLNSI